MIKWRRGSRSRRLSDSISLTAVYVPVDENHKHVEGLQGERIGAPSPSSRRSLGNKVAELKNPVFVYRASLGNL
jgi:hypothetical protein